MKRFLIFFAVVFTVHARAQDSVRAVATLQTATVYFGYGAELTHQSQIRVGATTRFIVISGLSTSVDVNSLQISVPESVALLSHRYNVVTPDMLPVEMPAAARLRQDSIDVLLKEMARVDNLVVIEQETMTKTGALIEGALTNGAIKPSVVKSS